MMSPAKQLRVFVNIIPEPNISTDLKCFIDHCYYLYNQLDFARYLLAAAMEGTERNL